MNFINADDVKGYIAKGYGNCSGKRLGEIDLGKIEEVLDKKSAIRKVRPTPRQTALCT